MRLSGKEKSRGLLVVLGTPREAPITLLLLAAQVLLVLATLLLLAALGPPLTVRFNRPRRLAGEVGEGAASARRLMVE